MTDTRFIATHSILSLNTRHPAAAKALQDAQAMHRLVMSGFHGWVEEGEPEFRSQLGVLSTWTVDLKSQILVLIVQSQIAPDWSRLPAAALTRKPEILPVDLPLREGARHAFRAVINPTATTKPAPGAKRGRHVVRATPDGARTWFTRRLQPPGQPRIAPHGESRIGADARPQDIAVRILPTTRCTTGHPGATITRAEIKGTLTITDPQALTHSLTNGIGRMRSYSAGLILLQPI